MRSYLSRYQPLSVWDDTEIFKRAGEAWRKHGVLLVRVDDLTNDFDRQYAVNLGEKLYGRRNG